MYKIGFDNELYLSKQSEAILERVAQFNDKLYLEFGGKLSFDYHAHRVLPGYDPNVKLRLLQHLKDQIEVIFCVCAADLENGRIRGDFGITYETATLKAIDDLTDWDIETTAVVINRFSDEAVAKRLMAKVRQQQIPVYTQPYIDGYPTDVDKIVSSAGYGRYPYIPTSKPIVIVTGAGPGSGKMSTCLAQMYHDHQQGRRSGYAKFETFPIWDLPVDHPVNVAYEAATADLGDQNMVDPFHLAAYGVTAINYNRDVESFPILNSLLERIVGEDKSMLYYKSPTDMGVNRASAGIVDDGVVREAARQEIIRRFFRYRWEYLGAVGSQEAVERTEELMKRVGVTPTDRATVSPARQAAQEAEETGKGNKGLYCGAALELPDGALVTGKNSPLLHAASAAILNGVKHLAGIPDDIHLLPELMVSNVAKLKAQVLGSRSASLNVEEVLIALGISAATNPAAEAAVQMLSRLRDRDMHLTHVPSSGDQSGLRDLGLIFTTDAQPTSHGYFLR